MNPDQRIDARTEAIRLMEKRLTMAENAGLAATNKLVQLVAICSDTQKELRQNHRHVMEAIDKLGATVGKMYEAVVVHEGRIGRIEQERRESKNGHADAE